MKSGIGIYEIRNLHLGSLTGTKVVFRLDSYGAKQMAELFGSQEILEPNRSISFGAHQMRDGVSLTEQRQIRHVATTTDLMKLDNLEAFIKFPRNLDISKLKFKIYNYQEKEPGFINNKRATETEKLEQLQSIEAI